MGSATGSPTCTHDGHHGAGALGHQPAGAVTRRGSGGFACCKKARQAGVDSASACLWSTHSPVSRIERGRSPAIGESGRTSSTCDGPARSRTSNTSTCWGRSCPRMRKPLDLFNPFGALAATSPRRRACASQQGGTRRRVRPDIRAGHPGREPACTGRKSRRTCVTLLLPTTDQAGPLAAPPRPVSRTTAAAATFPARGCTTWGSPASSRTRRARVGRRPRR